MKKIFALVLAAVMLFALAACTGKTTEINTAANTAADSNKGNNSSENSDPDATDVRVFYLNGSTGMGMAKIINDSNKGSTVDKYTFTGAAAADEITGALVQGSYDIAAVPTTLAQTLFTKTNGDLKIAAVTTLGVLYMLDSSGTVKSVSDLAGKTIYTTGEGSVPQFVLEYVLSKNGLKPGTDVKIEYLPESSAVGSALIKGEASVVMLPEPYVSSVLAKIKTASVALNMTDEYDKVSDYKLMQACIIVRKGFIDEHPKALGRFLDLLKDSADYVNKNISEASQLIADAGIIASKDIAAAAIPGSNIVFISGDEMVSGLSDMFMQQALFKDPSASVKASDYADMFYVAD